VENLKKNGNEIFLLDEDGEDIRKAKIPKDCVFVLGDHEGFPLKELKRLKQIATEISIGPKIYFASQVAAIVNNELDRRGI
ncbi:MAG: tRNA (pseudouridine(54)-N(1))-methyltransferase TrmY, partial [Nanoarchaeota archaeon]